MRATERMRLKYSLSNETETPIDKQITCVLDEMTTVGVTTEEFPTLLSYLERLHALRQKERREPISRDTIALIAGNLMGILLIVAYEQKHVITSKGFGQVIRPK
jgi:hypothetical protein